MIIVNNSETPAPRPRGRPRAFDRAEALAKAGTTFWRLGYEGASIVDLTTAMGITPQSLYAAFGSKAALYREALSWYQAEIGAYAARALVEEPTTIGALQTILTKSADEFTRSNRPQGCMIATATLTCADEHQPIADTVTGARAATLDALVARIERGLSEGDVRRGTDAHALARFVGAIIQGMSVQAIDGATAEDLSGIARLANAELHRHKASETRARSSRHRAR